MVSVYDVKPRFQALLRPLTNALARAGVTANQVTLAAALLSLAAGAAVVFLVVGRFFAKLLSHENTVGRTTAQAT